MGRSVQARPFDECGATDDARLRRLTSYLCCEPCHRFAEAACIFDVQHGFLACRAEVARYARYDGGATLAGVRNVARVTDQVRATAGRTFHVRDFLNDRI